MKLANVDGRAALVVEGGVVDVGSASDGRFGPSLPAVYDAWADVASWAATAVLPPAVALDRGRLGPPSPSPRQVFGIGINYQSHSDETGHATSGLPTTFTKFASCLAPPFTEVLLPSAVVDWEVELVVVVGSPAHGVAAADGWSVVAGLAVGQDLSERVVQGAAGGQFSLGKSYPGFGSFGPWLVTTDEVRDPDDLAISCTLDGEVVQSDRTSSMLFSVPRLVEELSAIVTLLPGDVIFTGTPAGVGTARTPPRYLQAGQVLESTIEGIGTTRLTFRA